MTAPRFLRLLVPALTLLLAACTSIDKADPARTGPFYTPPNVRALDRLPDTVRRIVLLPSAPAGPRLVEDTLRQLDRTFADTLTPAARAEIVPVSRDRLQRLFGQPAYASTDILPNAFLTRLAAETGADAFVFVDLTTYSPYPPLALGLRARLVTPDGAALWHFDNLFTAADPTVVNSARAHVLARPTTSGAPADLSRSVLQNPTTFAEYAATATWRTLPPR